MVFNGFPQDSTPILLYCGCTNSFNIPIYIDSVTAFPDSSILPASYYDIIKMEDKAGLL